MIHGTSRNQSGFIYGSTGHGQGDSRAEEIPKSSVPILFDASLLSRWRVSLERLAIRLMRNNLDMIAVSVTTPDSPQTRRRFVRCLPSGRLLASSSKVVLHGLVRQGSIADPLRGILHDDILER